MAGSIVDFHDDDYHTYTMISDAGQQICRFEVDRVYEDKGAVWGEVTVWYLFDGEPKAPVIAHKRTNMLTATRPGEKDLIAVADIWPWEEFYESVMGRTVSAQRTPAPPVRLHPISDNGANAPFLIEPFILTKGVSLLFGPGGTGKSMIGLAFAVGVASGRTILGRKPSDTGPVLYVDYEDTQAVHQLRLNGLLEGLGMTESDLIYPIMYLKPKTSVAKMRRELNTHMRELNPALVIVDSVGLGRGGDAMGSEETIRFFQALNTLDTAVLGVDHMTKDDTRSGKMLTPYGSVYTVNSVRLAWAIKAIDASTETVRYLNLIQTKRNNVAAHEPVGVTMEFHNTMHDFGSGGDVFQPVLQKIELTMNDRYWNESEGTLIDKACDYLELNTRGTIADIADELNASRDSVEKALKRAEGNRTRRMGNTKPVVWMLQDSDT